MTPRPLSSQDRTTLVANFGLIPIERLAKIIRRPVSDIEHFAVEFGMKKRKPLQIAKSEIIREAMAELPNKIVGRGFTWSQADDTTLRELVANGFYHEDIADFLSRPVSAVDLRAAKLKARTPSLVRSNAFGRALFIARYYLKRGDDITALHIIEKAIVAKDKPCTSAL